MREVARLVSEAPTPPVVVVSAMSGVTDQLVKFASALRQSGKVDEPAIAAVRDRHRAALAEITSDLDERQRVSEEMDVILGRLARVPTGSEEPGEIEDNIAAVGEDLSARLLASALRARGKASSVVDARTVVRTDARFGRARPQDE